MKNSILGKKWILEGKALADLFEDEIDDGTVVFHDPFLMKDMQRAVERIKMAIKKGERILIFGDYDVDGISGTALLTQTLRELGAKVSYRLPDRQSGYGLNMTWIEEFKKLDLGVLITVDCGISNHKEIEEAVKSGMDVIVTDHHSIPKKLPESALALLHPFLPGDNYPFRELSGSAVAYKFAVALMHEIRGEEEALVWRKKLADLASLGTVADCMQLTGENRWIVKNGIDQMRETSWGGLKKLMKSAGIDEIQGYDSDVIGFCLGPRINAAGRLETPYYALQLLLDENGSATSLAEKLEELNKERRAMVECAMEQAEERLQAENQLNRKIIITWDKDWPAGIIGLIAARLNEKYNRPTIVLEDRGGELVASCRSPHYFNVAEALREVGHHLKSHGGHAAAAGFTIDYINLEAFIEEIQAHADETIEMDLLIPTLAIDYKIELEEITFDLVSALNQKAPFGTGNVKPRFLISGVEPRDLQTVGREHGHVKFYLQSEKNRLSAIAFRFGQHFSTLQNAIHTEKKLLDVVFELDKSVWNGRERLELKVVDLRFSD